MKTSKKGDRAQRDALKSVVPKGWLYQPRSPERSVILMVKGAGIVPTGDVTRLASTGAAEADFAWLRPVPRGGPVMPGVIRPITAKPNWLRNQFAADLKKAAEENT